MISNEVPRGWRVSTVGQLYDIVGGGTPSTSVKEYWNGDIPWITSADIHGLEEIKIRRFITKEAIKNSVTNLVPANTIIVVTRVALGKIAITKLPLCFSQDSHGLINGDSNIYQRYALYYLSKAVQVFKQHNRGTTIRGVPIKQLSELPFILPPYEEQVRIAKKLDILLPQLREKKDVLQQSYQSIDEMLLIGANSFKRKMQKTKNLEYQLLQSVLRSAFNGRITIDFRNRNIITRDELLRRMTRMKEQFDEMHRNFKRKVTDKRLEISLVNDESLPDIPDNWLWTDISSLVTFLGSGITPLGGSAVYVKSGIPFIRSQNVYPEGIRTDDISFVPLEMHHKMARTHVLPNDVLLNITGASIGRCTFVPEDFGPANVNQHVCIIRTGKWMNPEYLSLWLNSSFIQQRIMNVHKGETREGINYVQVRALPVPITTIEEQAAIVERARTKISHLKRISERLHQTQELHRQIEDYFELLPSAILTQAFAGKLCA